MAPTQPTHVWVEASPGSRPFPGVLLEWRRAGEEFEGYVIYVTYSLVHPVREPSVHMQWLKASILSKR